MKEIFNYVCKVYVILAVLFLPLAIYCIVISCITKDKEAFIMGGSAAAIAVLSIVVILQRYLVIKKALKMSFKNVDLQGNLNYTLEVIDETLIITCLNTGEVNKIRKNDIKKFAYAKNSIFIRVGVTGLVTLQNDKEVRDFLKNNNMIANKK
ncbi:MAG TPA: hypothetical protein DDY77_06645 [Clostridiales bacterium]|nr:hypothetical protein [Clostridiales bacterium]